MAIDNNTLWDNHVHGDIRSIAKRLKSIRMRKGRQKHGNNNNTCEPKYSNKRTRSSWRSQISNDVSELCAQCGYQCAVGECQCPAPVKNNAQPLRQSTRKRKKRNNNASVVVSFAPSQTRQQNPTNHKPMSAKVVDRTTRFLHRVCDTLKQDTTTNDTNAAQADETTEALIVETMDECYSKLHKKAPTIHDPAKLRTQACTVCFAEFDDDETRPAKMTNCFHENVCTDCFRTYVRLRCRDGEVNPWITCPDAECVSPIHPRDLVTHGVDHTALLQFTQVLLSSALAKCADWVPCEAKKQTTQCRFGFVVKKGTQKEKRTCSVCHHKQTVSHESELDDSWSSLLKSGVVRACPVCKNPTTKDFGMCNAMQCGKCGVWWNWRSRRTASTLRELKEDGRRKGTLWEAGELAFQQNLERNEPKKFRALLETNGIKFDPNFVRGAS